MLIKQAVLDRIVSGEVDLIFRRWKKPTVVAGGTLRTSVGMLEIVAVDRVVKSRMTAAEATRAGYDTKVALLRDLDRRDAGDSTGSRSAPAGPIPGSPCGSGPT